MKGIRFSCAAHSASIGSKNKIHAKESPAMQKTERKPLFDLGKLFATPGALAALEKSGQSPMDFLSRCLLGNWGEIPEEDREEDQLSFEKGFRSMRSNRTTANDVV